MSRTWLTGLLGGLAAGAVVFAWTGALRAQTTPPPAGRVACVDVGKVFTEYQLMKDITEELKQLTDRLQAENDQRRQKNDALQATVDAMDRNDPAYVKKMAEVLEAKIGHKTWFDVRQAHSAREVALATDRIYRDILRATEEVARQAGYDVAVYREEWQPISMNPDDIQKQMRAREVIYASPAVDLTQLVLDKLNADYRSKPRTPQLYVP